jgi:hypothetical protein
MSLNRLLLPFVPRKCRPVRGTDSSGDPALGRVLGPWIPAFAGMNGDWFNGGANQSSSRSRVRAAHSNALRMGVIFDSWATLFRPCTFCHALRCKTVEALRQLLIGRRFQRLDSGVRLGQLLPGWFLPGWFLRGWSLMAGLLGDACLHGRVALAQDGECAS